MVWIPAWFIKARERMQEQGNTLRKAKELKQALGRAKTGSVYGQTGKPPEAPEKTLAAPVPTIRTPPKPLARSTISGRIAKHLFIPGVGKVAMSTAINKVAVELIAGKKLDDSMRQSVVTELEKRITKLVDSGLNPTSEEYARLEKDIMFMVDGLLKK